MKATVALVCSIIVIGVFVRMSYAYTRKRAKKCYAEGRVSAPSITFFGPISKVLFVSSMLLTLVSYWLTYYDIPIIPMLSLPYQSTFTQLLGASIILIGCIQLERAFSSLGNNYSPLFEAYIPFKLITDGAYRTIRHPIYLYNLFVSFGLAISSGSGFVFMNAMIGLMFILKAIVIEEKTLAENFPVYKEYTQHSYRLVPGIY